MSTALQLLENKSDPRAKEWLFTGSTTPPLMVLVGYVLLVKLIGPYFMRNRKPMNLKFLIVSYNILQIVLNLYIFIVGLKIVTKYNISCEPVDYSMEPIAFSALQICYLYHTTKAIDFIDTFFMVLRKKSNQISFLHVYHHSNMFLTTNIASRLFAGGHSVYIVFINSFVHVVMYAYYLLTLYDYGKNMWWKKYLTQLQLIQFLVVFCIYTNVLLQNNCSYNKYATYLMMFQSFVMLVLLGNFYYNSYIKKKLP